MSQPMPARLAHGEVALTPLADADREAKGIIREAEILARTEVLKAREAFELSIKEQRKQNGIEGKY